MRNKTFCLIIALWVLGVAGFWGCSQHDEAGQQKATTKEVTDKAVETIEKKLNAPIDKARIAHDMGDERTEAIDEVVKTKE